MSAKKVIGKIPGDIPVPSRKESQGYVDDLGQKPKFLLEELLERQNKILANKHFISKLPDKGEKVINFRDKILAELEHRNEVEKMDKLLSRLNIASEGKAVMSKLEWTGDCYDIVDDPNITKVVELDSEEENDPLKILAQPTGYGTHRKKIVHVPPEESLIKPEDLAEIESFKKSVKASPPEYAKCLVEIVEGTSKKKTREPFKPYKTTKSNVHDPAKEKLRKLRANQEVTAATPPLIVHGAAQILSLNESIKLQKEHNERLQQIQAKHAMDRLFNQAGLYRLGDVPRNIGNYRSQDSINSSNSEGDEEEVYDDEDNDKAGTVVFTIDSIEN